MRHPSSQSDRPLYLYIVLLGSLIATGGMTFLLLGVLGALGLITAVTDTLGGLGSSFASATTGSAIEYSFAFFAGLVSLAASWKMFREGPRLWLLALVVVFQAATAAVFHSWVSVVPLIPTVAAVYGLVVLLVSAPAVTREEQVATSGGPVSATARPVVAGGQPVAEGGEPVAEGGEPVAASAEPVATGGEPLAARREPAAAASLGGASTPATELHRPKDVGTPSDMRPTEPAPVKTQPLVHPAQQSETRPTPPPTASRRCADCGSLNAEDARFCNSCGSILPG